nr:MAG TPA: hypothetical protein [Caudoviricetes sp.]
MIIWSRILFILCCVGFFFGCIHIFFYHFSEIHSSSPNYISLLMGIV